MSWVSFLPVFSVLVPSVLDLYRIQHGTDGLTDRQTTVVYGQLSTAIKRSKVKITRTLWVAVQAKLNSQIRVERLSNRS